jgi:peptidoglycan L-alanyl-D-glutamate endopeptidase CwlK
MVDLQLLYPPFRSAAEAMLADLAADGHHFIATSGHRGQAEQDKLYAQGRTSPGLIVTRARFGSSHHNFGTALDLAHLTGKKIDWNESNYAVLGRYAKKHGLVWGGDWTSIKDLPHVEFDIKAVGLTLADLRTIYVKDGLPGVFKLLDAARKG